MYDYLTSRRACVVRMCKWVHVSVCMRMTVGSHVPSFVTAFSGEALSPDSLEACEPLLV